MGGGGGRGILAWGKWRGQKSGRVLLPQGTYPEHLVLVSQLEVCQEEVVKKEGYWWTLRVPYSRHGYQDHS